MCRYVATELAADAVINVGDVKFYLHKVCTHVSLQRVQSIDYIAFHLWHYMAKTKKNLRCMNKLEIGTHVNR